MSFWLIFCCGWLMPEMANAQNIGMKHHHQHCCRPSDSESSFLGLITTIERKNSINRNCRFPAHSIFGFMKVISQFIDTGGEPVDVMALRASRIKNLEMSRANDKSKYKC